MSQAYVKLQKFQSSIVYYLGDKDNHGENVLSKRKHSVNGGCAGDH